jgi:3-deoxy-manno-octulosonate cytidylyltransferase (CMP-KDO synthetase)
MLQHVWERASQARYLSSLIIATDDERIRDAAESFRGRVKMTRPDHLTGTDRAAEIASGSNADIIVNIQGDEPLIDPSAIDAAILGLLDDDEGAIPMGTLKKRIEREHEIHDPNVVKVVTDAQGNAIYFSRSPIPYVRDAARSLLKRGTDHSVPVHNTMITVDSPGVDRAVCPPFQQTPAESTTYFKHIGLYVYRREFLLAYSDLPVGPLERAERLEQLRALENGHRIRVVETEYESLGVDTPEDWNRVSALFEKLMVAKD